MIPADKRINAEGSGVRHLRAAGPSNWPQSIVFGQLSADPRMSPMAHYRTSPTNIISLGATCSRWLWPR
jgi:hypothetical protein